MLQNAWTIPEPPLDPPEYEEPVCDICGGNPWEKEYYGVTGEKIGCDDCIWTDFATDDDICPICGEPAEKLYRFLRGEIVGCDNCVEERRLF